MRKTGNVPLTLNGDALVHGEISIQNPSKAPERSLPRMIQQMDDSKDKEG